MLFLNRIKLLFFLIMIVIAVVFFLNRKSINFFKISRTVLIINNQKVKEDAYEAMLEKVKGAQSLNIDNSLQIQKEALINVIDDVILTQSAKQMDVKEVSDKDAREEIDNQFHMIVELSKKLEFEKQANEDAAKAKTPAEKKKLKSAKVLYDEWMKENMKSQNETSMSKYLEQRFYKSQVAGEANMISQIATLSDKAKLWIKGLNDPAIFAGQKKSIVIMKIGEKYFDTLKTTQLSGINLMDESFAENARTKKVYVSWIVYAAEGSGKEALDKALADAKKGYESIKKSRSAFNLEVAKSADMMSSSNGGSIFGGVTYGRIPILAEYNAFTMKKSWISSPFLIEYKNDYTNESKPAYIILRVDGNVVSIDSPNPDGVLLVYTNQCNFPHPEKNDVDWDKMKTYEMFKHKIRVKYEMGKQLIVLNKQCAIITTKDLLIQSFLDEINGDWKKAQETRKLLLTNPAIAKKLDKITKAAINYDIGKCCTKVKDRIKYFSEAIVYVDNFADLHYDLGMALMEDKKPKEARAQFIFAFESLSGSGQTEQTLAMNLKTQFTTLKDKEYVGLLNKRLEKYKSIKNDNIQSQESTGGSRYQ